MKNWICYFWIVTRNIAVIFLVFTVLFSGMHLGLSLHLCQGEVKSFSFIGKAEPCNHAGEHGSQEEAPGCPYHQNEDKEDSGDCCKDMVVFADQVDDFEHELAKFDNHQVLSTLAPEYGAWIDAQYKEVHSLSDFLHYKPPLLYQDIPKRFHSLLI